jgi:translation initiation factor IF-2
MGVRLNKVLSELNIGLQTAVDFLKNKKSLGEVKDDATPNTKISDEQYEALVREFKGDKDIKKLAEKIFPKKKEKEKKKEEEAPKVEARQEFKPLGKIDLDSLNKRHAAPAPAPAEAPKAPAAAVSPAKEEEKVVVAEKEKKAIEPKPVEEAPAKKEVEQVAVVEQKKTVVENEPETETEEAPAEVVKEAEAPKVFTLKSEAKLAPKVNVLGKIDLDSLNQSTRPKKKSKEEKKKEREEKLAQQRSEKKKRVRIGKERVDIEAEAKNEAQNKNKKNKQKGGNQNFNENNNQQQGGGKNKKNKNRQQKPLEVDDEAVARQVKETLARLTNKNQNKKGAKYRREKRDAVAERMNEEMAAEAAQSKVLKLTEFVTVSELATMMNVGVNQVIGTCMSIGIMVSINQRLDA